MFTYTYLHIKIYIVEVYINCNTTLIAPVFFCTKIMDNNGMFESLDIDQLIRLILII